MRTISRAAEIATEVKKSRFVARTLLHSSPAEALAALKKLREAERDATHHCWAYRLGRDGEQARYSDDGEPRGTAGPPILEVLKKNDATNVLLVVTRYYGGVKLGAGGLARAYGDAAKRVLGASGLKELRLTSDIEAAVPYAQLGALENFLAGRGGEISGKTFGEYVLVRLRLPAEEEAAFGEFYSRLVAGKSALAVLGRDYR